ncbi:MAG: PCP reductase family protein, partial [Acidobacteriota bacterium]
ARKAILEFAHQEGHTVITSDVVDQAMAAFLPRSAQEAMGIIAEVGSVRGASAPLSWSLKASGRLEGVPAGVMRGAMRLRAEALARDKASRKVTLQIVEEALAAGRLVMEARMKHLQSEATQQGAERRIDSVSRRPGGRKSRCPFAGLSASIDAAAEERIDSRKVSAAPRWTEQATRLLETVPEGFIRRMTRARVEALARRKGCLEATSEVVTEKLKSWRDNSLKAGITMSWDSAVLERVQRIPETVRGQIILEVERFAASQGRKEITNSFFEKVVNQWMNGMDFHQKKTPWETAHDLPEEFIRWQLSTRREILHQIAKRRPITVFNTHLAVVSTMRNNGQFPIHSSIKETGFLPKDDHLDEGLEAVEACLDRIKGRPFDRSAAERLAAVWEFYNHTERIDSRKMGLLEVSRGRTFKNLAESPRATLLYTGAEPERAKFQFNCVAEIVGPEDHRFRFLCGMLQLLDYERFHIHRPAYPLGYLFWVQEIVDMTPVVGGEASRIAQGPGSGPEDVPS